MYCEQWSLGGVIVPLRLLQWAVSIGYLFHLLWTSNYTLKVNIYWKKNAHSDLFLPEKKVWNRLSSVPYLFCLFSSLIQCFTLQSLFSARSKSLVMGEQVGPPSRPSSPSPQERVVKCGWLKKQRSIMKNWQQRWFVLRGDQLFYYKDEEETKPQV